MFKSDQQIKFLQLDLNLLSKEFSDLIPVNWIQAMNQSSIFINFFENLLCSLEVILFHRPKKLNSFVTISLNQYP